MMTRKKKSEISCQKSVVSTEIRNRKTVVKTENGYTVVYYKARFTEETSGVVVRAVFQEEDGEMKLAGFWLDSPGLRK